MTDTDEDDQRQQQNNPSNDPEVKVLRIKRGLLKSKLSKYKNFIHTLEASSQPTKAQVENLRLRKVAFEPILSDYNEINVQLEILTPDDSELQSDDFETKYYDSLAITNVILAGKMPHQPEQVETSQQANTSHIQTSMQQQVVRSQSGASTPPLTASLPANSVQQIHITAPLSHSGSDPLAHMHPSQFSAHRYPTSASTADSYIKLQAITMKPFSGNYEEWISFAATFKSIIINNDQLNNVQKYHYLLSNLRGNALQSLKHLPIAEGNFEIAWKLLQENYENTKIIAIKHVNAILDVQPMSKESQSALQTFINEITVNLEALKVLNDPVDTWDRILLQILSRKLDVITMRDWEKETLNNESPTFDEFKKYLQNKCKYLETAHARTAKTSMPTTKKSHAHIGVMNKIKCPMCDLDHFIYKCPTFLGMNVEQRSSEVKRIKLCCNCLRPGHNDTQCRFRPCQCGKRHNSLLHPDQKSVQKAADHSSQTYVGVNTTSQAFLSTATVLMLDGKGNWQTCRALLDSGAQANLISYECMKRLKLKYYQVNGTLGVINDGQTAIKHECSTTIRSCMNNFTLTTNYYATNHIVTTPLRNLDSSKFKIPSNIPLADKDFTISNKVDLLIGNRHFYNLLSIGQIKETIHHPLLQKTVFGWVLGGAALNYDASQPQQGSILTTCVMENVEKILPKFWELEEVPNQCQPMSREDHLVEEHFANTHSRDDEGRFIVRLPFKLGHPALGESQAIAQKRFHQLENRLDSDVNLKKQYVAFMREYIQLGHMQKVTGDSRPNFYLPHHPVIKQTSLTTKLRVVFDGSAKTSSNVSLNEILHTGPVVQDDIFSILIRFRFHRYVLSADVAKMYRQIKVHPSDTCYQRILWRENVDDDLVTFELNTVTYGTTPAAYLATKSLYHLAETYKPTFPEAARIIQTDFYVDDLLTGSDSMEHATLIASQISHILEQGGFELRKWSSNSESILQNIASRHRSNIKFLTIDRDPSNKILGLQWDINEDKLKYEGILVEDKHCPTKRIILSKIASIYDPVGLVSPVIVKAKCLMQKLWQLNVNWDESLPLNITSEWAEIRDSLHLLQHVEVNRFVSGSANCRIELHGFCDASSVAYGASIYALTINEDGHRTSELLCTKSRVAPLLTTTIPRLELSAALLLSKLMKATMKAMKNTLIQCRYWTDSTIVLCWLKTNSRSLKTFVANRVAKGTKDNPADILSCGSTAEELINNRLWWHGPAWLVKDEDTWPKIPTCMPTNPLESKVLTIIIQPNPEEILTRFSSLHKLLRVLNVCFRFATRKDVRKSGPVSASEIKHSLNRIVKATQMLHFPKEYHALEMAEPIHQKSCLLSFRPFLDNDGLIRIGGRISNSNVAFETQHQVILPQSSHLSKLIIEDAHQRTMHGGIASTLAEIRCKYWILGGRNSVKRITRKCIKCFKVMPTAAKHIMGELPASRVTPSKPFSQTGIDFAGPIMVKELNKRSKKTTKMYIAVFVCFATKAVHLEHEKHS